MDLDFIDSLFQISRSKFVPRTKKNKSYSDDSTKIECTCSLPF